MSYLILDYAVIVIVYKLKAHNMVMYIFIETIAYFANLALYVMMLQEFTNWKSEDKECEKNGHIKSDYLSERCIWSMQLYC
jgi:hypothetical protein